MFIMNYLKKNTVRRTWMLGVASITVMMFSLSGCKKDNPLSAGRGCANLGKSSDAFYSAYLAFSENPSAANCEKFKKSLEAYYNDARSCTGGMYKDLWAEAEEALEEWEDLNCSEVAEENGN